MISTINHITLRVKDLDRSYAFYTQALGLKRVGQRPGMDFYTSGTYNHELALVETPNLPQPVSNSEVMHIAFNVGNRTQLKHLHQRLNDTGFHPGAGVDHSISVSFYCKDPDGYILEFTCDRDNKEITSQDYQIDKAIVL